MGSPAEEAHVADCHSAVQAHVGVHRGRAGEAEPATGPRANDLTELGCVAVGDGELAGGVASAGARGEARTAAGACAVVIGVGLHGEGIALCGGLSCGGSWRGWGAGCWGAGGGGEGWGASCHTSGHIAVNDLAIYVSSVAGAVVRSARPSHVRAGVARGICLARIVLQTLARASGDTAVHAAPVATQPQPRCTDARGICLVAAVGDIARIFVAGHILWPADAPTTIALDVASVPSPTKTAKGRANTCSRSVTHELAVVAAANERRRGRLAVAVESRCGACSSGEHRGQTAKSVITNHSIIAGVGLVQASRCQAQARKSLVAIDGAK